MRLSVVLPCYNEEENIETTVRDVLAWFAKDAVDGEVVVVNDGARDGSPAILAKLEREFLNVRTVTHPANRGYGAAITSGCDAARGDIISFMDSDGQFHAEDMRLLLAHMNAEKFVTGRRAHRADDFHRKVNAFFYNKLVRVVLGVKIPDINCGMKMFSREIWPKVHPQVATGALFNAEVYYHAKLLGIPVKSVPVRHYPRTKGVPDGARPTVIATMFKELMALKREAKERNGSVRSS